MLYQVQAGVSLKPSRYFTCCWYRAKYNNCIRAVHCHAGYWGEPLFINDLSLQERMKRKGKLWHFQIVVGFFASVLMARFWSTEVLDLMSTLSIMLCHATDCYFLVQCVNNSTISSMNNVWAVRGYCGKL